MSSKQDRNSDPAAAGVVNPDPPRKRDLVERALSDGMTDPAKIADWAKNYNVSMTVEEVQSLAADIRKPKGKGSSASRKDSRS